MRLAILRHYALKGRFILDHWAHLLKSINWFTLQSSIMKGRTSRLEVFCKKGVLKFSLQNSQENTCTRVSILIKLQALGIEKSCFKTHSPPNGYWTNHIKMFKEGSETSDIYYVSQIGLIVRRVPLLKVLSSGRKVSLYIFRIQKLLFSRNNSSSPCCFIKVSLQEDKMI